MNLSNRSKRFILLPSAIFCIVALFAWHNEFKITRSRTDDSSLKHDQILKTASPFIVEKVEITEGSTYGNLMEEVGIPDEMALSIFDASKNTYDLSKIKLGSTIVLAYDKATKSLTKLIYQINDEEELTVIKEESGWVAEIIDIPYETRIAFSSGVVESSMYDAALKSGIDERAIVGLANIFQWSIDFAMDPRQGDEFKFIYEQKYRDGEYITPGEILAGKYVNNGKALYVFHFEEPNGNSGHFDENGNSVQKIFLKAPVEYKYISSGFTTGRRYVQAFNVSTGHRAIDYAASYGTPIRSVGDGTVSFAGWNGSYGNFITIRHNGTYSTNYAHLSKIAVKKWQRVTQGQIIGYVGSTGFSTGPHLHYEMVKNGTKINPLLEIFPPGKEISKENKQLFLDHIESLKNQLD